MDNLGKNALRLVASSALLVICEAAFATGPVPVPPPFASDGATRIDVTTASADLAGDCGLGATPAIPGDGLDDGCAIQSALDSVGAAGGGVVYLPAGDYDIDRTLVVDSSTWVIGSGPQTRLVRGPSTATYSAYGAECSNPVSVSSHQLFVNREYNCGNRGITLFNFTIDGSSVSGQGSPLIGFSAITDTHIWSVSILDAPGDGIYLRNGGIRTSVRDTEIHGFRGAGIAVEMLPTGYVGDRSDSLPNRRPGFVLANNRIISVSGGGGDFGIRIDRPDVGGRGEIPRALIQDNRIDITDGATGVACFECGDTTILDNQIFSSLSGGDRTFSGIRTTGRNIRVLNNFVLGWGVGGDGPGIVVRNPASADIANTDATVVGNRVLTKTLDATFASQASIEVSGIWRVVVKDNVVLGVFDAPGIAIGDCVGDTPGTSDVFVASNSVTTTQSGIGAGYSLRLTDDDVHFMNNQLDGSPLDVGDVELCRSRRPNQH